MEHRDLGERLLQYGVLIIKVVQALPRGIVGRRLGDELLRSGGHPRSGSRVGAHYEEARAAESRGDFTHKLQIALKELRESNYWLRLLHTAAILPPAQLAPVIEESNQLRAILSKAVATTKGTNK